MGARPSAGRGATGLEIGVNLSTPRKRLQNTGCYGPWFPFGFLKRTAKGIPKGNPQGPFGKSSRGQLLRPHRLSKGFPMTQSAKGPAHSGLLPDTSLGLLRVNNVPQCFQAHRFDGFWAS